MTNQAPAPTLGQFIDADTNVDLSEALQCGTAHA